MSDLKPRPELEATIKRLQTEIISEREFTESWRKQLDDSRRSQSYWKANLNAANDEISSLKKQLDEVRALPDKWRKRLETHYLGEDDFLHGRKDANHTCANELEAALQGEKE